MAKGAKKPGKQQRLPGTEDEAIPDVDRAADLYAKIRDKRCALSKKETEAQDELKAVMRDHKLTTYRRNGILVKLKTTDKATVEPDPDEPAPETTDDEAEGYKDE